MIHLRNSSINKPPHLQDLFRHTHTHTKLWIHSNHFLWTTHTSGPLRCEPIVNFTTSLTIYSQTAVLLAPSCRVHAGLWRHSCVRRGEERSEGNRLFTSHEAVYHMQCYKGCGGVFSWHLGPSKVVLLCTQIKNLVTTPSSPSLCRSLNTTRAKVFSC